MAKIEKVLQKLLKNPKDFSWAELKNILYHFGYKETHAGRTSGSRVRFIHSELEPICLHKPHPSEILKPYQLSLVIGMLKDRGHL